MGTGPSVVDVERHRARVGAWVVAARTDVGKVRNELQDAWFAGPVSHLGQTQLPCFAVFDGLGGLPFGREAAWAAAESLPEAASHASTAEGILRRLHEHVRPTQGATTAVVALFPRRDTPGAGFLLTAGDSAAFVHLDGQVHHLPLEVSPGGVLLLCTDGVTDVIAAQALRPIFEARDLLAALDDVLADVLAAGAPDNATMVAARRIA